MGTRVVYEIIGDINDQKAPICILFSNSSHGMQKAEKVFHENASEAIGPTDFIERLVTARYETAAGNHRAGDRVFWISDTPYGDYEFVLRAEFTKDQCDIERIDRVD